MRKLIILLLLGIVGAWMAGWRFQPLAIAEYIPGVKIQSPQEQFYTLELVNGTSMSGVVTYSDQESVTLQIQGGGSVVFERSEIKDILEADAPLFEIKKDQPAEKHPILYQDPEKNIFMRWETLKDEWWNEFSGENKRRMKERRIAASEQIQGQLARQAYEAGKDSMRY